MVVTVTMTGYIKRTPLDPVPRRRSAAARAAPGMATKDEDAVTELFVTSTHNPVLFFSTHGKVYRMKVWRLPEGAPDSRAAGRWSTCCRWPRARPSPPCCRCPRTRRMGRAPRHVRHRQGHASGATRWTPSPTSRPPARSRCASDVEEARTRNLDRLIGVELLTEEDDVLLATRNGKAIRFDVDRRARIPEPHFDRRARRPADRRRRGHLACRSCTASATTRKSARPISAPRPGRRRTSARRRLPPERYGRARRAASSSSSPSRQRLWQAQLGL